MKPLYRLGLDGYLYDSSRSPSSQWAFEKRLVRLKAELGVAEDREAASFLGMTKFALSTSKKRDSFPVRALLRASASRPELQIDVAYVLCGRNDPVQQSAA